MKNLHRQLSRDVSSLNNKFEGYCLNACIKDKKVINFSPGPTQIPVPVLDLLHEKSVYGVTPYEISHRCPEFNTILNNVNNKMRKFMQVPSDFTILWTQGGGHGQFAAIPLNFKNIMNNKNANYVVTGTWSDRAYKESLKFIKSHDSVKSNNESIKISNLDDFNFNISEDDKYVYLCSNETVNGLEFKDSGVPYPNRQQLKNSKLIIDMSSDMCMKKINWENVDMAFACTSKNLGIAGANVVIVRNNLLDEIDTKNEIPSILDWNIYKKTNSLYNTPAIFNIFLIDKILDYYISIGGIETIEKNSILKAKLVYEFLDQSKIFKAVVTNTLLRSNINIPFIVANGNSKIMSLFLNYCYQNNIVGLRTKTPFSYEDFGMIEPLRISLYNGISIEETYLLINTMKYFEETITNHSFEYSILN